LRIAAFQRFKCGFDDTIFQLPAADRADKLSIGVDEHLTAHVPRRGTFAFHHRAQRSGSVIFFQL
jgi:hypothetical protein